MKKLYSLGIFMLISLVISTSNAQIHFDLSTVGGTLVMNYDAVNAERNKTLETRWITAVNFAASGTAGVCSPATRTFDIRPGRTIDFFLAKCDRLVITANIASGRGLVVSINGGAGITLNGTGACVNYTVDVNSETPVQIRVDGLMNNSAWTSLFTFHYEEKTPKIGGFQINGLNAIINETNKTIQLEMPFGTDLTQLTPVVTLAGIASSFSPAGPQNFASGAVTYTATHGAQTVNYAVTVTARATPDSNNSITQLTINGRPATINQESGLITAVFPSFEGPLALWPVVFSVNSVVAQTNFQSGSSHNFALAGTLTIVVTAQDNSIRQYTVVPEISTKKNVALLSVNGRAEAYDGLFLSAFQNYYVHHLTAASTAPANINDFYALYDVIVLHANVAGTNATAIATEAMVGVKPILNMKAFFYNSGRWSWSTAAPQNAAAGTASADVEVRLQNHPIFQNVSFNGTTLTYYDNLPPTNGNSVQFASDLATLDRGTSFTLATVNTTGIQMHEIQDVPAAKFIMVGLSMENNNYNFFNTNTLRILSNSIEYLLNPTAKYNYLTSQTNSLSTPELRVYSEYIYNPLLVKVRVYTVAGIRLLESSMSNISLRNLPKGVYVMRAEGSQKSIKFIR